MKLNSCGKRQTARKLCGIWQTIKSFYFYVLPVFLFFFSCKLALISAAFPLSRLQLTLKRLFEDVCPPPPPSLFFSQSPSSPREGERNSDPNLSQMAFGSERMPHDPAGGQLGDSFGSLSSEGYSPLIISSRTTAAVETFSR